MWVVFRLCGLCLMFVNNLRGSALLCSGHRSGGERGLPLQRPRNLDSVPQLSALSVTRPPSFLPSEKPAPEQVPVVAQVFRVEDRRHAFKTAFCGPGLVIFRAVA